jgi:Xaa-Pro aminopeptidase
MTRPPRRFANDKPLSRRDLLRRTSGGLAASLGVAWFGPPRLEATTRPAQARAPESFRASLPKSWSRDEIKRRWAVVRKAMRDRQLDALLIPSELPDGQWLTASSAGWILFPLQGTVTAFFSREALPPAIGGAAIVDRDEDLGLELRGSGLYEQGMWSPRLIEALREHKLTGARIGVGSLENVYRNLEGSVNYTTYARVLEAFPKARFVSAVDLLMRAKLVRGPEEIAVFEKINAVGDMGLQAMMDTARPGVPHREVWNAVWRTMWEASGEFPTRVAVGVNALGAFAGSVGGDEPLPAGAVLSQEIAGTVLGYGSQVNHSVLVGSPGPANWESSAKYCIELFHDLLAWIAPGKSYREFMEFYGARQAATGMKPRGVMLHTSGYGDGPRSGPGDREEGLDLFFETGQVFDMKAEIMIKGAEPAEAQFGDGVVVTERGARRLGARELALVTLGA